ncbi:MAG: iron chelate uptake ABC transporter family permease subunit [Christensenellaceae bacterium]|jgi:iron complex transport system permease protein|nr:iron chelate uptake ABC transporter family permease subunit [Christensenellaceae bacterium]
MDYIKSINFKRLIIISLFVILVIASMLIGALESVTVKSLFQGDQTSWMVIWSSRLPRTLAVILSAAGLSVAGLIMQAISRNKFMSPSTAGASDAAGLGIMIAYIALNTQEGIIKTIFGFFFALIATLLFTSVINRMKIREVVYVPLIGMMYGGLISAITTLICYHFDAMQLFAAINQGSFARIGSFATVYIIIVPVVLAMFYAARFSIIGLGEDFSKNLGLNYNRVVFLGLVIIALISAASYTAVGPLPFVGLIIPNMTTTFYGDNIKKSMLDLMFFGADFVLICDIISRLVIFPFEMSVSLTISVIGGIVFMGYVIATMRKGKYRGKKSVTPSTAKASGEE